MGRSESPLVGMLEIHDGLLYFSYTAEDRWRIPRITLLGLLSSDLDCFKRIVDVTNLRNKICASKNGVDIHLIYFSILEEEYERWYVAVRGGKPFSFYVLNSQLASEVKSYKLWLYEVLQ